MRSIIYWSLSGRLWANTPAVVEGVWNFILSLYFFLMLVLEFERWKLGWLIGCNLKTKTGGMQNGKIQATTKKKKIAEGADFERWKQCQHWGISWGTIPTEGKMLEHYKFHVGMRCLFCTTWPGLRRNNHQPQNTFNAASGNKCEDSFNTSILIFPYK